ncbi:hypothetical protein [Pseudomonas sp. TMP9]|uniref:hypothetical protein n=1 Tax=unclassified Pseudomonas TaxID=196821 RepID=UPI0030CDD0B8
MISKRAASITARRSTDLSKEKAMDDYQEELLDARSVELDVPELEEDATEL